MRSNRNLALALVLVASALPAAAVPPAYLLVDLGRVQEPAAINRSGVVVGTKYGKDVRANVYENGEWTSLKTRRFRSFASAVNCHGDVVGRDGLLPVLWRQGHRRVLDGLGFGYANGIADDGTIVGSYTPERDARCYAWKDGSITDLGTLGGKGCTANAIDPSARYISGSANIDVAQYIYHAFVHDAQGMHDLGTLGGFNSVARAVNRYGHAAVWTEYDSAGPGVAAYWNGHELIEVPGLRGNGDSTGVDINRHDEMLVRGDDGTDHSVFIYDGRSGTVTAIDPLVLNAQGWYIDRPSGLSDDGHIVGIGWYQFEEHGYMLVPMAP